jgi:hypothetical protein
VFVSHTCFSNKTYYLAYLVNENTSKTIKILAEDANSAVCRFLRRSYAEMVH